MAGLTIARIEAGIDARVESEMDYLRTHGIYNDDIEALLEGEIPVVPPAVLVAHAGTRWKKVTSLTWRVTVRFSMLVFVRSARGKKEAKHGGPVASERGAFKIMDDLYTALVEEKLGLEIKPIEPVSDRPINVGVGSDEDISLYEMQLETSFNWQKGETIYGDLLTINIKYYTDRPPDDAPDSESMINLS